MSQDQFTKVKSRLNLTFFIKKSRLKMGGNLIFVFLCFFLLKSVNDRNDLEQGTFYSISKSGLLFKVIFIYYCLKFF